MKFKLAYISYSQISLLLLAILLIAGLPLLLVLTDSTKLSASDYTTKFEHLSIEDGLSQSVVFSILQDRNGYIWFGTQDGLNKYDGIDFTIFNRIPDDNTSISDDTISTIFRMNKSVVYHMSGKLHGYYAYLNYAKLSMNINEAWVDLDLQKGESIILDNSAKFTIMDYDENGLYLKFTEIIR